MRFPSHAFDPATGVATFDYLLDGPEPLRFTEAVEFPPAADVPEHFFRVLDLLHVVAGVSYYKVGAPPRIEAPAPVPAEAAALFTAVYTDGLAEYAYRNDLPYVLDLAVDVPGVAPAAAPVDNLILEQAGADASLEDLVASTERGLLLTTLWYIREVDPQTLLLTGLTRDGVFLVENGEVTGAVNNFRFNESPVDLLGRATEASRSERTLPREWNDWFTRAAMPMLRVPDFNMSSVSPAS
jgi:hypothetical protein